MALLRGCLEGFMGSKWCSRNFFYIRYSGAVRVNECYETVCRKCKSVLKPTTWPFPFLSFLALCRTFILYFFHYLRTSQEDKVCDAAKCSSSERWRTKAENWLKGKSEWVNKRVSGWIMNVWICVTLCKHSVCHSVTSPERWCCWGRTDNSITSCCSSAELQNLDSNTLNASKL